MKKIYIRTTNDCQLRCKHCYVGDYRNQTQLFDENKTIEWLKKYIKEFKIDLKDTLISFHGGEPFLCPIDKMEKITKEFPEATFDATTNLVYNLTLGKLDFIKTYFKDKKTGIPFIKTSWDYKIRFSNNKQNDLWEQNVLKLLKEGIQVQVIICLTSLLIKEVEVENLLKYFVNLGVKIINFERLTSNTTEDKSLIPSYKEQDEYLYNLYMYNKNTLNNALIVGMFEELENVEACFKGCRARQCMREVITINADGSIGACPNTSLTFHFTSIDKDPSDLLENTWRDILIEKEEKRKYGCCICSLYEWCNGDCHQLDWEDDGTCPAPKKILQYLKENLYKK